MVIGNAAYQNVPPLNTPTTDAAEVSKLLRTLDFSVIELTNVDKVGMERPCGNSRRKWIAPT